MSKAITVAVNTNSHEAIHFARRIRIRYSDGEHRAYIDYILNQEKKMSKKFPNLPT